jgi:hypothetical protein
VSALAPDALSRVKLLHCVAETCTVSKEGDCSCPCDRCRWVARMLAERDLEIARYAASTQPRKRARREATFPRTMRSHTFDPTHLYSHKERGETACGAHVGIEATYHPTAWLDLGPCTEYREGGVTFTCESSWGHK